MQNIYFNLESFFENYIKNKNLKNAFPCKNISKKEFLIYSSNINSDNLNTYLTLNSEIDFFNESIHPSETTSLIVEEKNTFIKDLLNIEESLFNQIISLNNFIFTFYGSHLYKDSFLLSYSFLSDNNYNIIDNTNNINLYIEKDFFSVFNIKFTNNEHFSGEILLDKIKYKFISELKKLGVDIHNLNLKKLNKIYKQSTSEFLNSVNKLKNLRIKSKEEIESIVENKNYFLYLNKYYSSKKEYNDIKLIFKEILDKKNHEYFCQSIDLIYYYINYIVRESDIESSLSINLNKFKTTVNCYSISFYKYFLLDIGVNINDEKSCSLFRYSVNENLDEIYSNNMYDFYIALLNAIKEDTLKIINKNEINFKNKITIEDIKILQILKI